MKVFRQIPPADKKILVETMCQMKALLFYFCEENRFSKLFNLRFKNHSQPTTSSEARSRKDFDRHTTSSEAKGSKNFFQLIMKREA